MSDMEGWQFIANVSRPCSPTRSGVRVITPRRCCEHRVEFLRSLVPQLAFIERACIGNYRHFWAHNALALWAEMQWPAPWLQPTDNVTICGHAYVLSAGDARTSDAGSRRAKIRQISLPVDSGWTDRALKAGPLPEGEGFPGAALDSVA